MKLRCSNLNLHYAARAESRVYNSGMFLVICTRRISEWIWTKQQMNLLSDCSLMKLFEGQTTKFLGWA
ncbi:hypothetical protein MKW98_004120 [Papaver atlanticum]|uniref:Uncharacterized protein n=1 Tax=Papaver atlanticum TaxID=357466 RepID=A0AAD4XNT6_9MAGN|nr:hypothetical protein MKW98_004120 [Papaver atlanticum]